MQTIGYPEEAKAIQLEYDGPRWTPPWDVKVLCYLAQEAGGTILEIGCNEGRTTRELALACPDQMVIGVDSSNQEAVGQMVIEQRHEGPPADRIGAHAKSLPNVHILDYPSHMVWNGLLRHGGVTVPADWGELGFAFIDGNHSYAGVKADTEMALDYFVPRHKGIIAWHDCYVGCPKWCGVKEYLETEVERFFEVKQIADTWIATLTIT